MSLEKVSQINKIKLEKEEFQKNIDNILQNNPDLKVNDIKQSLNLRIPSQDNPIRLTKWQYEQLLSLTKLTPSSSDNEPSSVNTDSLKFSDKIKAIIENHPSLNEDEIAIYMNIPKERLQDLLTGKIETIRSEEKRNINCLFNDKKNPIINRQSKEEKSPTDISLLLNGKNDSSFLEKVKIIAETEFNVELSENEIKSIVKISQQFIEKIMALGLTQQALIYEEKLRTEIQKLINNKKIQNCRKEKLAKFEQRYLVTKKLFEEVTGEKFPYFFIDYYFLPIIQHINKKVEERSATPKNIIFLKEIEQNLREIIKKLKIPVKKGITIYLTKPNKEIQCMVLHSISSRGLLVVDKKSLKIYHPKHLLSEEEIQEFLKKQEQSL